MEKSSSSLARNTTPARLAGAASPGALNCRKKFLRFFKGGFYDEKYVDWERGYKWEAHEQWEKALDRTHFRALLSAAQYGEAAARAIRIESRTNVLFSFEKWRCANAIKSPAGARAFSEGALRLPAQGRGTEAQVRKMV